MIDMKKLLFLLILFSSTTTAPSFAGVVVIGGLVRQHTVKPGQSFEGVILVKNTDTKPMEIALSQTDYLFTADGASHYDKPGTRPRSNAPWMSISPPRVTVPPQATISVYYKGKTPETSDLAGTYWSMIMVEPVATPSPKVEGGKDEVAMSVQTVMRYAVQIVTAVGATGTEQLAIEDKKMTVKDGKSTLLIDVANTGERVQIPALSAELFNAEGISIGHFQGGKRRIYPRCSVRYGVKFADVPPGKYTAMVVMDSGGDYVTGAQYTLEIAP